MRSVLDRFMDNLALIALCSHVSEDCRQRARDALLVELNKMWDALNYSDERWNL